MFGPNYALMYKSKHLRQQQLASGPHQQQLATMASRKRCRGDVATQFKKGNPGSGSKRSRKAGTFEMGNSKIGKSQLRVLTTVLLFLLLPSCPSSSSEASHSFAASKGTRSNSGGADRPTVTRNGDGTARAARRVQRAR